MANPLLVMDTRTFGYIYNQINLKNQRDFFAWNSTVNSGKVFCKGQIRSETKYSRERRRTRLWSLFVHPLSVCLTVCLSVCFSLSLSLSLPCLCLSLSSKFSGTPITLRWCALSFYVDFGSVTSSINYFYWYKEIAVDFSSDRWTEITLTASLTYLT